MKYNKAKLLQWKSSKSAYTKQNHWTLRTKFHVFDMLRIPASKKTQGSFVVFCFLHTVDGKKNPAPPGMYNSLKITGKTTYQLVSRISEPSTVGPVGPFFSGGAKRSSFPCLPQRTQLFKFGRLCRLGKPPQRWWVLWWESFTLEDENGWNLQPWAPWKERNMIWTKRPWGHVPC